MCTSHDVNTHEIVKFSMFPSQRGQVAISNQKIGMWLFEVIMRVL